MIHLLALRTLLKRIPWQAWAILALLAVWYIDRTRHGNERAYEARAEMQAAIDRADAERAKALASEEQALRDLAKRTDRNAEQARAENHDAVERFIRSGGVRPQACASDRDTADRSAGDSAPVHPQTQLDDPDTVSVKPDDVRICTANTITAEALREFVLGLEG